MRSIFRRLRGVVGTALTWAVGWAGTAFALATGAWFLLDFAAGSFLATVGPMTLMAAGSGFISGSLFSLALGTVYRHRSLSDLRAGRIALWGAGAAILFPTVGMVLATLAAGPPMVPGLLLVSVLMMGGLGAVTAGGMVKLAQLGTPSVEAVETPDALPPGQ